ncbi:hypothetical protein [Empedobacter sp. R132-2]|uniref:hypothetical protein n=1 Tax=Empedobacter sp. R132-2 TaxID=2746740 RepID=UPI0025790BCA|nr:hypothetical protein [Empedobacter sp. R132-2]MDM1139977.1 hypothetical protein [Empedobacter sp. R132-2]
MRHSMKTTATKGIQVILIIIFSVIIASLFGAILNQFSYSVSSEFFTNFLFGNFGTNEWNFKNERLEASIVGIIGSYWVGLILGIIYAIIFLFMRTENNLKNIKNAILINIGFSILGSLIAYLIAKIFVDYKNSGVFMEFGTQNPQNYLEAAFMNTGSYFGGIAGIVAGIIYLLKKSQKTENQKNVA